MLRINMAHQLSIDDMKEYLAKLEEDCSVSLRIADQIYAVNIPSLNEKGKTWDTDLANATHRYYETVDNAEENVGKDFVGTIMKHCYLNAMKLFDYPQDKRVYLFVEGMNISTIKSAYLFVPRPRRTAERLSLSNVMNAKRDMP